MKIVVIIDGGIIQRVIADQDAEVLILDRDTDGCTDTENIKEVLGDDVHIYSGLTTAENLPETVEKAYQDAKKD